MIIRSLLALLAVLGLALAFFFMFQNSEDDDGATADPNEEVVSEAKSSFLDDQPELAALVRAENAIAEGKSRYRAILQQKMESAPTVALKNHWKQLGLDATGQPNSASDAEVETLVAAYEGHLTPAATQALSTLTTMQDLAVPATLDEVSKKRWERLRRTLADHEVEVEIDRAIEKGFYYPGLFSKKWSETSVFDDSLFAVIENASAPLGRRHIALSALADVTAKSRHQDVAKRLRATLAKLKSEKSFHPTICATLCRLGDTEPATMRLQAAARTVRANQLAAAADRVNESTRLMIGNVTLADALKSTNGALMWASAARASIRVNDEPTEIRNIPAGWEDDVFFLYFYIAGHAGEEKDFKIAKIAFNGVIAMYPDMLLTAKEDPDLAGFFEHPPLVKHYEAIVNEDIDVNETMFDPQVFKTYFETCQDRMKGGK